MKDKKCGATALANGTHITCYNYNIYPPKTQVQTTPEQLYFTQRFLWLPTKGGTNE